jgi:hypothetical protein
MARYQTLYPDGVVEAVVQYHFAAKVHFKPEEAEVLRGPILQHAGHPQTILPGLSPISQAASQLDPHNRDTKEPAYQMLIRGIRDHLAEREKAGCPVEKHVWNALQCVLRCSS